MVIWRHLTEKKNALKCMVLRSVENLNRSKEVKNQNVPTLVPSIQQKKCKKNDYLLWLFNRAALWITSLSQYEIWKCRKSKDFNCDNNCTIGSSKNNKDFVPFSILIFFKKHSFRHENKVVSQDRIYCALTHQKIKGLALSSITIILFYLFHSPENREIFHTWNN